MRGSRSQVKYALRQCKRSEDTIKADRLAGDLLQQNAVDFWEKLRNVTSNKASNSTCIDAVVGEQNIAEYGRSHYEGIFNSVQNTTHQNDILRKLETTEFHEDMTVTTNEVAKVIKGLKRGKAVGPDNVAAEALIYTTKIDGVVCPSNIAETVAVRTVKLAHRPRIASTTITFISKPILLSIL